MACIIWALSLSLSLSFCFRHASSSFVCVVVVFVCVAFVLCFWSSKTHTILGREKEKERINPTQTLNPKKHTKTHVKKERRKRFWKEKKIRALALARIIVLSWRQKKAQQNKRLLRFHHHHHHHNNNRYRRRSRCHQKSRCSWASFERREPNDARISRRDIYDEGSSRAIFERRL